MSILKRASSTFLARWRSLFPLTARVPMVSGVVIFVVVIIISRMMMTFVAHEQELGVRQIAAVYLDGIATTVFPHVVSRNFANTNEALRRTMWFHQGMREQRAIVQLPDGSIFADVSGPRDGPVVDDPLHDATLRRDLEDGGGFVFDVRSGTGWASRAIVREGKHVADLYVAVELKALIDDRESLRHQLLWAAILSGLAAAVGGSLIVRRMVLPIRSLTEHLRRAQVGQIERVPPKMLPPASSEHGRLLRGYNDLVEAIGEREALSARLAQQERDSVLGRLAATIAHEVRNPLAGMSTALNTTRKFGDDPEIRSASLDLIERGLLSIGDVVDSVLAFHRMPLDGRRLTASDLNDLRTLIEPEMVRRQLRLAWNCGIQRAVDVAATEARQIALNLLLNACQASPPGGVVGFHVWTQCRHGPENQRELILQVVDHGPGLPEVISSALTTTDGGEMCDPPRGLGIRVVRDLVRALDGRIIVENRQADQGSSITILLPIGNRDVDETVT